MAINNETAKTEERNSKLFLRDYVEEVLSIITEEKKRNIHPEFDYDTGTARDAFMSAVKAGKVLDGLGNDPAITAILRDLFPDYDWSEFKAKYDAQTEAEQKADLLDFNRAVDEHIEKLRRAGILGR
jgi:hypothetical protein